MRLAELQNDFLNALWSGDAGGLDFAPGPVTPQAALAVHRNTVLGALTQALRLGFSAVLRLVGEDFFDATACAFVLATPPTSPTLAAYGEDFPAFLRARLAPSLAYVAEVARFEAAIDRALQHGGGRRRFALEAGIALDMPAHLGVLMLEAPADLICDALDDEAALATLDPAQPRCLLVWREGGKAAALPVSAASAAFIAALYASGDAQTALAAAQSAPGAQDAAAAIQGEIFAASFCRVTEEDLNDEE